MSHWTDYAESEIYASLEPTPEPTEADWPEVDLTDAPEWFVLPHYLES